MPRKKSMGRRKIPIEKIQKKQRLQVTFSKRRMGIFKKACELSVLCGAEMAILVQSPAHKIFSFGSPSVEAVLDRFLNGKAPSSSSAPDFWQAQIRVWEATRRLEMEKEKEKEKEKERKGKVAGEECWWNTPIEDMELDELEYFQDALEGLRAKVVQRLVEETEINLTVGAELSVEDYRGKDIVEYTDSGFPTAGFYDGQEFDGGWMRAVDDAVVPVQNENVAGSSISSGQIAKGFGDRFPFWEYLDPTDDGFGGQFGFFDQTSL